MKYKRYRHKKFTEWKKRVFDHLPHFVPLMYSYKGYIPYEKWKLLGTVIKEISNPNYSILNDRWDPLDEINQVGMEVILQIQVNELFSYIKSLRQKP